MTFPSVPKGYGIEIFRPSSSKEVKVLFAFCFTKVLYIGQMLCSIKS